MREFSTYSPDIAAEFVRLLVGRNVYFKCTAVDGLSVFHVRPIEGTNVERLFLSARRIAKGLKQ